jgi:hypothetical protein
MEILGFLILFVVGGLILFGIFSELRESVEYRDLSGIIKYGLILLVIISLVSFLSYNWYIKTSIRSNFHQYITSYVETSPYKYNYSNNLTSFSKIVIIDKKEKIIHNYHFSLPEDRKAKKPTDVDVIVWLEFNEQFAGYYGTTKKPKRTEGFIQNCKITLINHQNNSIIATKHFTSTASVKISYRSRSGAPKKRVFRVSKTKIIDYIIRSL